MPGTSSRTRDPLFFAFITDMSQRESTVKLPGLRELFPDMFNGPQSSAQRNPSSTSVAVHGNPVHHCADAAVPVARGRQDPSLHTTRLGASPAPSQPQQSAPHALPVPEGRSSGKRTNTHDLKPHICDICERPFSRPGALLTHMNSHTGAKPFQCDFLGCDRIFSTKSNMRRHSHIHDNQTSTSGQAS